MTWAFVELMRDRKVKGMPRLSARAGARKLEKEFARDLKGGRFLYFDTIRRYHKDFEKAAGRNEKAQALAVLQNGRRNRERLGWDASPWMFLLDPALFQEKGYELNVINQGHFTLKRPE
jgi:hypothetical protein